MSSRGSPASTTQTSAAEPRVALVAALVAFAFYVPRLCPTLCLMGDSGAFVAASVSWGIAQPPGYPLLATLGKAATFLPFGELPWRVHLTSALCHAATVGIVAALVQKLTGSRAAALGGGLCLAFSRAFFQGSLYAEAFPLNDAFTALLLLLGVSFHERAADARLGWRALAALFLASGLAAAHHQMIALSAPGLAVFFGAGRHRWLGDPRRIARLAALFLGPFLGFQLLLWVMAAQSPASNWGDVHDLSSLLELVTRQDYGGPLSPFLGKRGEPPSEQLVVYASGLLRHFGALGVALIAAGAISAFRRARATTLAVLLVWIASGPVFAMLNRLPVADEAGLAFAERFSTMSEVPLGVLLGAGVGALERALAVALRQRVASAVAAATCLVPLAQHAAEVDLADDRRGLHFAEDLVLHTERGALVLVTGDAPNGAVHYLCGAQKRCGEIAAFSPGQLHLPWFVRELRRRRPELVLGDPSGKFLTVRELVGDNLGRHPVYLSPMLLEREPPLREAFGYLPDHLLLRVISQAAPITGEAAFVARARRFESGESCSGCAIRRSDLVWPSLETALLQAYVDAWINHARVLRVYFGETELAARFEARALAADRESARGLL